MYISNTEVLISRRLTSPVVRLVEYRAENESNVEIPMQRVECLDGKIKLKE